MPNYSLVLNNKFQNRSFDDLLKPLAMYTDVYNQQEAAINELEEKASIWEGLADKENDPIVYSQYKTYADDLKKHADTLASVGLNPQVKRGLLDMKRRYASEIVPIEQAYTAMQEERKRRRDSKDNSMLYATDNLKIGDFMKGNTPNLYEVSGDELYKRGAQAAASASSRIYDNTKVKSLTKYYQEMIQKVGYNPDLLYNFRQDMASIPELRDEVYSILKEKGVEDNLTGANYARAMESVINGMVDGAIYKENSNIQRDYSHMTASEAAQDRRSKEGTKATMLLHGYVPDNSKPGGFRYDWWSDPKNADKLHMFEPDENGNPVLKSEFSGKYQVNPDNGKVEKVKPSKDTKETTDPIYKLAGKKGLLNESDGFSFLEGNTRHKYKYIGAISSHSSGKPWQSGNIGEDIPGHWGAWNSSNLSTSHGIDFWNAGDYTTNHIKDASRVITPTESMQLMYDVLGNGVSVLTDFGKEFLQYIIKNAKERGIDVPDYSTVIQVQNGSDISTKDQARFNNLQNILDKTELVEVPSKRGRSDYLVATKEE